MEVKDQQESVLGHLQHILEGLAVIDVVHIEDTDSQLGKLQFGQVGEVLADEALGLQVQFAETTRRHLVQILLDSIDIDIQRLKG